MKNDFKLKKCSKCGAVIEVFKDCNCDNCGFKCCGLEMVDVLPNLQEASFEKHIPNYEVIGPYIEVQINHVMEENHYIEYIALDSNKINAKKYFNPGETAKAIFPYIKGSKLYGYCNLHGLWEITVK